MISVDCKTMYEIEKNAFEGGFTAEEAMEIAAMGMIQKIELSLGNLYSKRLLFVCGTGNNGGDGFACARLSLNAGASPLVLMLSSPRSELAKKQLALLEKLPVKILNFEDFISGGNEEDFLNIIEKEGDALRFKNFDIIVDCLFGIGFKGSAGDGALSLINCINNSDMAVLSCDLPSGMNGDSANFLNPYVRADETITMGYLKDCLLFAGEDRAGRVFIRDIHGFGLEKLKGEVKAVVQTKEELRSLLPRKKSYFHKGNSGHLGLFVGSRGMAGAGVIAGRAAMKSGLGLASYISAEENALIYQISNPHIMLKSLDDLDVFTAIGAGCGLGTDREKELFELIERAACPVVLDADALNMLAKSPKKLGKSRVITPHVLECARLLDISKHDVLNAPFDAVKRLYERYECSILLKNNASICFDGESFIVNALEAKSLAKAGSGDCLLGLLAGIIAQKNARSYDKNDENSLLEHRKDHFSSEIVLDNSRLTYLNNKRGNEGVNFMELPSNPYGTDSKSLALASLWLSLAGNFAYERQGISSNINDVLDCLGQCIM